MGKNGYFQKKATFSQTLLTVGEETGFQKCFDFVQLCLRDPRVVGNDAWGKERLKRLFQVLTEYDKEFAIAFQCREESDVKQEHLDRALSEIHGEQITPFHVRYPHIKKIKY